MDIEDLDLSNAKLRLSPKALGFDNVDEIRAAMSREAKTITCFDDILDELTALHEEQKKQAEEQSAAAKSGKVREIVVIVLTALTLTATIVFGVIATLSAA